MTDDQRARGTLAVMPNTIRIFREGGTRFTNFYATTPLCCPSRGSFWNGQYAHNHGVRTNGDLAAERRYAQWTAVQRSLKDAGYSTALVGKYWNRWPLSTPPPNYGWWARNSGGYNDASFNVNGTVRKVPGYNTDVLGSFATGFLNLAEQNDGRPWFLYVAPQGPHEPYTAPAKYEMAPVPSWNGNPAVFESDRSDKPPSVRWRHVDFAAASARRAEQLRTLMAVDDLVQRIFVALKALGEANDTLAIFTSDNGYMWGEHRIADKRFPYPTSVLLPMYVRWPGRVAAGATRTKLTANIDVEPTILKAAGITPTHRVDGASLFSAGARSRLLLEYFHSPDSPLASWASTLTPSYQYTEWYGDGGLVTFREYYDVARDPWRLTNLLADGNAANDPNVWPLRTQLAADRSCAGSSCP
jgi:arylsulfatase A-like enzyme